MENHADNGFSLNPDKKHQTKAEENPEEKTTFYEYVVDKTKFKFSPWLISSTHRNGTWLSSYKAPVWRIRVISLNIRRSTHGSSLIFDIPLMIQV